MYDSGVVVPVAGMITAIVIVSIVQYYKHRLKLDQMKIDAQIRIEEIRTKGH